MADQDFMDPINQTGAKADRLKKVADKVTKTALDPNSKINARALLKKVIQGLDHDAKMKALDIIRAEIEASPKIGSAGSMSKVATDYTAPPEPPTTPYDPTEDPESGIDKLANKKDYKLEESVKRFKKLANI